MNPSTALARVLVDELVQGGVTDVVLAPGSRNAPLSMALFDADATGRLRLHVRIDERTAGFLAVGLARGSGRPVPVVTTSGTAVANLHPAVLEAHHGGVPLLVLSADRPPALRDVGANQVIDQRSLFGQALRFFHEFGVPERRAGQNAAWRSMVCRALAQSRGAGASMPGPAQLNICLTEPLLPDLETIDWPESLDGRDGPWTHFGGPGNLENVAAVNISGDNSSLISAPEDGERVLFLGDLTHPAAGPLAALGHIVVSEAGGAAGAGVISAGLHLLALPQFLERGRPDRVIVLGRPTLYRQVSALLADSSIAVDVVAPSADYPDVAGRVRRVAPALAPTSAPAASGFGEWWKEVESLAAGAVAKAVAGLDIGSSPRLAAELVAALPDGTTLVLGSSQPPRDVGLASAARNGLRLLANRGVAGIDGTVSTAVGAALAAPGPTVALMGDLTFLHDMSGLVIGPHEPRPDLVIVVPNNDGGGIFHTLESGDPLHASAFERVFGTPHGVQLSGLADASGWEHMLVSSVDELPQALDDPAGIRIVEVPVTRTDLRAQHAMIRAAVQASLGG